MAGSTQRCTLLSDGRAWLHEELPTLNASEITYSNGTTTATLPCRISNGQWSVATGREYVEELIPREFIVAKADWAAAGFTDRPRIGDKIKEVIDGVTYTFEVLPLAKRTTYDESLMRAEYRIRTKQIAP